MKAHSRGAVAIETGLSIFVVFGFLLGATSVFSVGYGQVAADGFAFERSLAMSGHADYEISGSINGFDSSTGLKQMLSYVFPDDLVNNQPTPTYQGVANPIGFSYNSGPDPYGNPYGVSAQYTGNIIGGASYIRAAIQQSQYQINNVGGLGKILGAVFPATATGATIEPTAVAVNRALGALPGNPTDPSWYQDPQANNWIVQQTVNLMPMFLSHQIDYVCADDYEFPNAPDCLNGHSRLESYGVAEYLDSDNYAEPPGVGPNEAFNAMLIHQRCFAELLTGPNALPSQFPLYSVTADGAAGYYTPATGPTWLATAQTLPRVFLTKAAGFNPILNQMYYAWDVSKPTSEGSISAANKPNPTVNLPGKC